jgi:hypothetical protein
MRMLRCRHGVDRSKLSKRFITQDAFDGWSWYCDLPQRIESVSSENLPYLCSVTFPCVLERVFETPP